MVEPATITSFSSWALLVEVSPITCYCNNQALIIPIETKTNPLMVLIFCKHGIKHLDLDRTYDLGSVHSSMSWAIARWEPLLALLFS
jgi:hypothetical protein